MSHLRRAIALIMLALVGWLVAFGAAGAASASASVMPTTSTSSPASSDNYCC